MFADGGISKTRAVLRLIAPVCSVVFVIEVLVMLFLDFANWPISPVAEAVFDALLLGVISAPILYYCIFRSFVQDAYDFRARLKDELEEKREQNQKLETALARLDLQKRVLDQHAIVSETDVHGIITYANDAFCNISGHSREELVGQNHRIVNSAVHPPEFWDEMYAVLSRGDVWQGEVCNQAKDGRLYWLRATNAAVRDSNRKLLGFVSVRTDITESKLRQQRLELTQSLLMEARTKAEAANQAKSEFLATMSHEIRTPMNGVMGMLGLLSDLPLSEEQQKLVNTARDSADSLLVIINDILDYSKLDAGRIQLEVLTFSPLQIVDGVTSLLSSRATAKGLQLTSNFADAFPTWILGDPTRLRQILFNLVGNAIKFTEFGGVHIHASWTHHSDQNLELRFEVRDTGIGIPAEARSRLFTRFTQADGSTTRKFGGTGLGLAICKQLANMMGGQIGVESEVGEGSLFWFTIRAERSAAPLEVEPRTSNAYDEILQEKLRILVADDNHVNQMFVSSLLGRRGHTVDVAANGLEAVDAVAKFNYDLVLMDVQMPEMDGITATREIRKLGGETASIPIIALTANAMSGQREEYLAAGMDDYVSKPIDPVQLFAAMAKVYLRKKKSTRPDAIEDGALATKGGGNRVDGGQPAARKELPEPALASAISPEREGKKSNSIPLLDTGRIAELRMHISHDNLLEALNAFPGEARECDLLIRAAVQKDDLAAARRAAHRLKGMATNFGAARLAKFAQEIEHELPHVDMITARIDDLSRVIGATNESFATIKALPSPAATGQVSAR